MSYPQCIVLCSFIHTYVAESTLFSLRNGRISICQFLIAANADINAKDLDGQTPLHFASRLVVYKCLVTNDCPVLISKLHSFIYMHILHM